MRENINEDPDKIQIEHGLIEDAEEILKLQKLAYLSEAEIYNDYSIQPLTQTLESIKADFSRQLFLKATIDGIIVGSVRGCIEGDTCHIGRLIVRPDYQNRGIGRRLMKEIEAYLKAKRYVLFTGHRSERNLRLYHRLGYRPYEREVASDSRTIVYMEKVNKSNT